MQPVAPHTNRGIIHILLRILPLPPHTIRLSAPRNRCRVSRRRPLMRLVEEAMYPIPRLLAHHVRVVRRRAQAHGLSRARVHIARDVHALLDHIRFQSIFVVDDDVVRRSDGTLQSHVRLEVKVVVDNGCNAFVDDSPWFRVAVLSIGVRVVRGVEARVVAFTADNDAELGLIAGVLWVDALECLEYLGELFSQDFIVLALNHIVR